MKKRRAGLAAVLCLFTVLCGCGGKPDEPYSQIGSAAPPRPESAVQSAEPTERNPLTGLSGMSRAQTECRPVAVMINNITVAQPVQAGLCDADIVYETYVEGGITRLLAVYQDIGAAGQIGTVRSGRYSYVDLAAGHDAVYVHAGIDKTFCLPYANKITDHVDLFSAPDGTAFREKNGLAYEHRLYTTGEKLKSALTAMKRRTKLEGEPAFWADFNPEDAPETPAGGEAGGVTVPMSGKNYRTEFVYDAKTGLYTRTRDGEAYRDCKTGDSVAVTNVFVLFTDVDLLDEQHVKEAMTGGNGYYVSRGGYTEIRWKKGDAKDPLTFTETDGSPLPVNSGKSWVFLAKKDVRGQVVFS